MAELGKKWDEAIAAGADAFATPFTLTGLGTKVYTSIIPKTEGFIAFVLSDGTNEYLIPFRKGEILHKCVEQMCGMTAYAGKTLNIRNTGSQEIEFIQLIVGEK